VRPPIETLAEKQAVAAEAPTVGKLKNIAKTHLESSLAIMSQAEAISALASVVLSLAPQLREAFDAQLEVERSKNEMQREVFRQQLLMLDLPYQNRPN
jgi:hypothetical protein